jgi:transposase
MRNLRRFARGLQIENLNRRNSRAVVPCGGSLLTADDAWVLRLIQGKIDAEALQASSRDKLTSEEAGAFIERIREGRLAQRNRAVVVSAHLKGITMRSIAGFLQINRHTARQYCRRFNSDGVARLFDSRKMRHRKSENLYYREAVFKILHAPPATYGFNRTTWKLTDLKSALGNGGITLSRGTIRGIIRSAGFRFRKAKKVLTSTDPQYRRKLRAITNILRNLRPDERFFSIDEFGPFAIKIQGGRCLVKPGQTRTVPMRQRSKGRLICTAALELSTNQVTHFYSEKKNTDEMLKLLDMLLAEYSSQSRLYLSWDAASWHISGRLKRRVREINSPTYQAAHMTPRVSLAPLPACAQFLNVIESVFSGMARAIIHNSDYPSADMCKAAIDRYFAERNQHFREHPKRAGNKLWGAEIVPPVFAEGQNCKDPRW